jgi:hypothetical protein
MGSQIGWLDFSEHERRKALDVIDMFREREARDELGIGTVRDALSDVLFPGVSTIQTRARYFLFIPWIYRSLERKTGAASDIERLARREEIRLIDAIADSGETDGVIGIDARADLKRLPSHIYWQGLQAWGLRRLAISQSEYHRFFARFAARSARRQDALEDEGDRDTSSRKVWNEELPTPPDDFPQAATFAFRKIEGEYLRERLLARQSGKLLTYLVDHSKAPSECAFPWEHPQLAEFPERNRIQLEHARRFSLVMHGAALLYNLMLCKLRKSDEDFERYRGNLDAWAANVESEQSELARWDRREFWQLAKSENPHISSTAQNFINTWLDMAIGASPIGSIRDRVDVQTLIANREKRLKGAHSRFANERALELWGGESGAYQLSFRWYQVQRIVNDIGRGLGNA